MTKTKNKKIITSTSEDNNTHDDEHNDKDIHAIFLAYFIIEVVAISAFGTFVSIIASRASFRAIFTHIVVINELVLGSTSALMSFV